MVTSLRTKKPILYFVFPLLLFIFFISQSLSLSPLNFLQNNLFASSGTFPSAQFKNSPVGFEFYKRNTDLNPGLKDGFVSRGNNYALFLTPSEAVVTLAASQNVSNQENKPVTSSVLHMQFLGANKSVKLSGQDDSGSKSHYYIGNDPAKWVKDVTRYGKVQYKNLYPGIDLVFYGNQNELEYDFIVASGVNPDIIRLGFTGADKLSVNQQGDLLIHTPAGRVLQKKPLIYQTRNNKKEFITGSYALLDKHTIGFDLGRYDPDLPLIIDPVLDYTTYVGGSDQDNGTRIAIDQKGYIYITGYTFSTDFPSGAVLGSNISSFITKLTPDGTSVVFSLYLGGSGIDRGRDIAIGDDGNIYIIGETTSLDFPVLASAPQSQNNGGTDVFLSVLSPGGNHLHYSTYYGGSGYDSGHGLALGNNDAVYLTGETWSKDLPVTTGAFDTRCGSGATCVTNQNYDAFFTVLDVLNSNIVYSTYLGGSADDKGHAIAVDLTTGYGYIAGQTNSSEFPRQNPILPITSFSGDNLDGFLTVIDPALTGRSSLIYSTLIGGQKEDVVDSITLDTAGNAYIFGYTNSIDFPVKNAYQAYLRGETDSFIAKINPAATTGPDSLIYATYLGGSGAELSYGVAIDQFNRAYIVGTTSSTDFPTVAAFQTTNAGGIDAFVATVGINGDSLTYASYFGGSGDETGSGIAVASDGTTYIVGDSASTNLPASLTLAQSTLNESVDTINAFVTKISRPEITPVPQLASTPPTNGNNSASTGGGAISPIAIMVSIFLLLMSRLKQFTAKARRSQRNPDFLLKII